MARSHTASASPRVSSEEGAVCPAENSGRRNPSGAGDVAQLAECLSDMHKALGSIPSIAEIRGGGAYL